MSEKEHLSIVICGHVDSGKSTTTGRLLFELGGLPERELEKLKQEAERLGKGSFAFAFFMDRQKEERERGVTISSAFRACVLVTSSASVIPIRLFGVHLGRCSQLSALVR